MTRKRFIAALYCLLVATCSFGANTTWADGMRKLVLVAATGSDITRLAPADIRKLFLGVPVNIGAETLRPLRNASDPTLDETFLQKVVFMSRDAYERALLTRAMHGGGVRPVIYDSEAKLVSALLTDKFAVTYMWADKATARTNLKIVAELWQEN
ncbi:MAG: hypothetical protein KJ958_00525 [Gammaproteobacteria bacterium]|nr:hypothetical protein [Gammaproteobacteria bacterium]MBU1977631.1 hypothetical protein [Gammaproteobacteria bacterium]